MTVWTSNSQLRRLAARHDSITDREVSKVCHTSFDRHDVIIKVTSWQVG